jgi:hypothetical protein
MQRQCCCEANDKRTSYRGKDTFWMLVDGITFIRL